MSVPSCATIAVNGIGEEVVVSGIFSSVQFFTTDKYWYVGISGVAPIGPVAPVAPVGPVAPCSPVIPCNPLAPVAPTGPVAP